MVANEETFDIKDIKGRQVRVKYDIKNVPTVIITGDLDAYETLKAAWDQVGTIEDDGAYVFRELDVLQVPYKDLTSGEIVNQEDIDSVEIEGN